MLFVVILLALVILVIVRRNFIDHFNTFSEMIENVPIGKTGIIDHGKKLIAKNQSTLQDTKINKEIIDKIIGNMINKDLTTENDTPEEGDFDTKILNQRHKIFTEMTNNKILLKNLKLELKKLVNSNKPVDVIKLSFDINNK